MNSPTEHSLTELGVVESAAAIASGDATATQLTQACLDRITAVDGQHTHDGDSASINAWVRVYADDALAAAERGADQLRASGAPLAPLLGVPVGLKDLYAVAGKPVTASSRVLDEVAAESSDVWLRLEAAGMILLGHLHTHEFAAGGTTDQVGNPWDLSRSAGGSSGGSGAALAARMVPAATGTDTAGSLRIPVGVLRHLDDQADSRAVSTGGLVPLSWTLDHPGPMARSLLDCQALYAAMRGTSPDPTRPIGSTLAGTRLAISPQLSVVGLDPDVAAGFERALDACRQAGATLVEVDPPPAGFGIGDDFLDIMTTDMLGYHARFGDRRHLYRPALREWLEMGESRSISGARYAAVQAGRVELTDVWRAWLSEHQIDAVIEPTIPIVAPVRGDGYDHAGSDYSMISLTSFWDWTGFPAVSLPSALGSTTGLPVSVSLIGDTGADWRLLELGIELQELLGIPAWPSV